MRHTAISQALMITTLTWLLAAGLTAQAGEKNSGPVTQGSDALELSVRDATVAFKTTALDFQGGSPAVELLHGKTIVTLLPTGAGVETTEECQTPMGPAHARTWSWRDPRGYSFSWTVSRLANWPGFTLKMTMTNQSTEPVKLRKMVLCQSAAGAWRATGVPGNWFLSTLDSHDSSVGGFNPSGDLATDARRKFLDTLTLFTDRGAKGLIMSAVGPAEADVRYLCDVSQGRLSLEIDSEMNDIVVDPGESRRSEEVLVLAAPYETAITNLFRWLASTHGARTARGPIFGWCSWYSRSVNIRERDVEGLLQTVAANRERLPFQVMQIDDGWQKAWGDWTADPKKFPHGMKAIAAKIAADGMLPGVWLCMVRTSPQGHHLDGTPNEFQDSTNPAVRDYIRRTLQEYRAAGYSYFKLDFNTIRQSGRYDQKKTRLQVSRDLFKLYREAIGEDAYLNACVGGLNRGCIGYADAVRIATDSCVRWRGMYVGPGIPDTVNGVGGMALANGILFAADPDCTYAAPQKYANAEVPFMPEALRAWHGYVGLLGGLMMTSDLFAESTWDSPQDIRMMEILNPPAPDKGRAFDGQTDPWHKQFGFAAVRPWGNFVATLLFNPSEQRTGGPIAGVPLDGVGQQFHAWSFWDEKYYGLVNEKFVAPNIPAHGAVLLRLTAVPKSADQPVLIGSNLHISMGSAEIKDIQPAKDSLVITLTNAGARDGKLVFFSHFPLKLAAASGCVAEVATGENTNIWTVALKARKRDEANVIRLDIVR